MISPKTISNNQKKLSDNRFRVWRQQLRLGWQAVADFMTHNPAYRPTREIQPDAEYSITARFYPFYPPVVEHKAWLEKCYQTSGKF